jgi:tRNA modification GTPase
MLSCPPLVNLLIAQLLNEGTGSEEYSFPSKSLSSHRVRAAQPGEFTLRGFLAGKLDLTRAEAIRGVIEAGNRAELKQALAQLAGGLSQPLQQLRYDLLNLLADVEAGLDFTEEDIQFVDRTQLLIRLTRGLAQIVLLQKQLEQRAIGENIFRVVLAGQPNAGKSSLFNVLGGESAALVSPVPGTTRDYLVKRLNLGGVQVDIVDTAGWQSAEAHEPEAMAQERTPRPSLALRASGTIDEHAQHLGRQQAEQADLILLCVDAGMPITDPERGLLADRDKDAILMVATKCDLHPTPPGWLGTSAVTGAGVDTLRAQLADHAQARRHSALAPSLSRCQHHVTAILTHLRRAHDAALHEEPMELLALELRGALDDLGEMVGAFYTDELLDRIFSRFCIGK